MSNGTTIVPASLKTMADWERLGWLFFAGMLDPTPEPPRAPERPEDERRRLGRVSRERAATLLGFVIFCGAEAGGDDAQGQSEKK